MYIIPGYTRYQRNNNVLTIKSLLFQSLIEVDEKEFIDEFYDIIKMEGTDVIDTYFKKILHDEGIIQTKEEIVESLNELK